MNSEIPIKSYERDEKTRTAVDQLRILLNDIYAEPSPDIFTLDDFINRYPLTGLGELAIREIEQSRRINNSINDYAQIALCDFHVGLIFLYWGDFRGAINQFNSARKKWSFSGPTPTNALCYFAEGLANYLALHYEEALRCYGLGERALELVDAQNYDFFCREISAYIRDAQLTVRNAIWASVRARPAAATQTARQANTARQTGQPVAAAPSEPAAPVSQMADTPYVHSAPSSTPPPSRQDDDANDEPIEAAPMPQTNLPSSTRVPIPGHGKPTANYTWYQVESQPNNQLYGDIQDGDWLLVQNLLVPKTTVQANEPILVSMQQTMGNAIHIRPDNLARPFQRIYLAKYDDLVGTFSRDPATGKITFQSQDPTIKVTFSSQDRQISVQWSAILGIVVGFWRNNLNGLASIK